MRLRLVSVLLALGCARELDLPSTTPLSVTPAFTSVAPRESITLAAAGGIGGYTFAFAEGGQLSGKDATIDAASGAYQAGALGSAQDVITVTDSSGASVQARLTVGQKLFLSPATVTLAPGGRTQFSATGGKPPYKFSLDGGSASMTIDARLGVFFAGTDGNTTVQVVLKDQTNDARAKDTALVAVGAALQLFAPGQDSLTPYGAIDLIATGGQPPYTYSYAGNSGGFVAPATGHYIAGPSGGSGVSDVVSVHDANDQSASLTLNPGPPLALQITSQDLHPGLPVSAVATGGKPPYTFAFDARGNRSNGALDSITGQYTPGQNFGATDVIVVHDSTPGGLAKASATGTAVGPQRWTGLRSARRFTADLDGDQRADLVSVTPYPSDPVGMLETRLNPASGPPVVTQYHYTKLYDALAADLNGDGHADLALLQDGAFRVVLANPDGSLGGGTQIATRTNNPSDRMVLTSGVEAGKVSFFYTDYTSGNCIARYDGTTLTACALSFTFKTPPSGLFAFAAADLNLDGALDLAWVDLSEVGKLHVAYGPAFTSGVVLGFGTNLGVSTIGPVDQQLVPYAHAGGSGLLIAMQNQARRGVMAIRASAAGPAVSAFYDPTAPSGPNVYGILSLDAVGTFLSFDHLSGAIRAFDTSFNPVPSPLPQASFAVDTMALGDLNGDSALDVVVGNTTLGLGDLVLGDGPGVFGQRPRITGIGFPFVLADIDGDGVRDFLTVAGGSNLQVVFRTGLQFAYGPQLPVTVTGGGALSIGAFTAAGSRDAVYQSDDGTISFAQVHADGSFGAPVQMHMPDNTTAFTQYQKIRTANFGDGPFSDLFGRVNGTMTALLHDPANPSLLTVGASTPVRNGTCQVTTADIDGNGTADVVVGCGSGSGAFVQISSSSGSKASLAFSAFQTLFTSTSGATSVVNVCNIGNNEAVMFTTREIVAVTWNGTSFQAAASPLGAWSSSATVANAACQRIDGDALADIALTDSTNKLHFYLATAIDQFTEVTAPALPAQNLLLLENAAGAPGDLLLQPPGAPTEYNVLINDGSGNFP